MNKKIFIALTMVLGFIQLPASSAEPPLNSRLREEIITIPSKAGPFTVQLQATTYRPPGEGPFPLLIMNHGKDPGLPSFQGRYRGLVIATEFVQRGYAVILPMRTGFSKSEGMYVDGGCNITSNGVAQAKDIQATLDYASGLPWIDNSKIIVMGQSHGGLATMALGASNPSHVKALLNFAGGLRYDMIGCSWKDALIDAFAYYGKTTTIPSLWFYGENDSFFNPEVVRKMFVAYTKGGADAKLVAYGPFKNDAHGMSGSRDGVAIWWPETEALLKRIGLPTEKTISLATRLPSSGFAKLEDSASVPFLNERTREFYEKFLKYELPRAFAISPSNHVGWAWGGDDPSQRALENCQKNSKDLCQLYAIDEDVVWQKSGAAGK
jgi:dienelactone hydrolase